MTTRTLLLGAVASLAFAATAGAYERNGWYVGLEGGGSWIDEIVGDRAFDLAPPGGFVDVDPGVVSLETGWAAFATVGYGFGNRFRLELEGGYRSNDIDPSAAGDLTEWTAMVNVLYDLPLTQRLGLSLGVGAGGDYANFKAVPDAFEEGEWQFAYQGIAGLSYALTGRLDVFANYRYLRVNSPEFTGVANVGGLGIATYTFDDFEKHAATLGLRYHFGAPAAEPMIAPPPPPPMPAGPAAAPKEFIVFFGYNKSNLTAEANQVIREAAAAAKEYGSATITLVGHADRSGSPKYNMALSQRRAGAVKAGLVAEGVAGGAITTSARGESEPLVQTDDGVREPQNRRVHINL